MCFIQVKFICKKITFSQKLLRKVRNLIKTFPKGIIFSKTFATLTFRKYFSTKQICIFAVTFAICDNENFHSNTNSEKYIYTTSEKQRNSLHGKTKISVEFCETAHFGIQNNSAEFNANSNGS